MATHVIASRTSIDQKNKVKLHHMPCTIKSDGAAKVSEYFEPCIVEKENGVLTTSFRGRPLLGREVDVPGDCCGLILQETRRKDDEEYEKNVYVTGRFDKFTYWNYDQMPTTKDKIVSMMEWIDISSALHSPSDS